LIDSTDHQQNSKSGETKKHHRPQNRLSVCLSVCRWRREREEEEEEKERGEVVEAPARQICQTFIWGRTNKQKPPKTFLGFLSGKEGIEEEEEEGWRIW